MKKTLQYSGSGDSFVNNESRELIAHGTPDFRLSVHETDLSANIYLALHYHWHDELEFLLMSEGCMRIHIGTNEYVLRKDDIAVILPGIPHTAYRIGKEKISYSATLVHHLFISSHEDDIIQREYIAPLFAGINKIPEVIPVGHAVHSDVMENLKRIRFLYLTEEYGFEILIKSELLHIVYALFRCTKQLKNDANMRYSELWIKNILAFIHDNFEREITLDEFSRIANMSKSYLCRSMKKVFGATPLEVLTKYRLSQAVKLIETTENRITDIAFEVGFSNINGFTAVFKKHYACTPSQYRKKSRKGENYGENYISE